MKTVNWTHNASRFCEIAFKANRGDKIKILREKKGHQGTRVGSLVCVKLVKIVAGFTI